MKTNKQTNKQPFYWLSLTFLAAIVLFGGCKKDLDSVTQVGVQAARHDAETYYTSNPYSLRNIERARRSLIERGEAAAKTYTADVVAEYPQYIYFKFDPQALPGEVFHVLEQDSTIQLLDFPFASAEIYDENFALDESKKADLVDGKIYGITTATNRDVLELLQQTSSINVEFLDTLALVPEADTTMQMQALREAGATSANLFGICLLKRPSGYVQYFDNEMGQNGRLEPVRGMQVWGLVFGIPIYTHTDQNGHYNFPWRFSAGTVMGTKAINDKVTVKPFNTLGGFLAVTAQLVTNFVVGSVHVKGFVSSCDMRSDVNFEFRGHDQPKYWSQILNAYYFQAQYAAQTGVLPPPNNMICYAHWADDAGFGSASTPMLYHLTGGVYTDPFLLSFFGNPVTGTLANLTHQLLPDMTFKVCGQAPPQNYNSRLAQIAFHELGHASMFGKVGGIWHLQLVAAELNHTYGTPGYTNWGKVQVAESWAEFIGTENALRRYPNGMKYSAMLSPIRGGSLVRLDYALEYEDWYAESSAGGWIPSGMYFDLIDGTNNINETWDTASGATIGDMFAAFNPTTENICQFRDDYFRTFNISSTFFNHYALNCR